MRPYLNQFSKQPARFLADSPWPWTAAAFAVYFHHAQFIVTVSWNAIELIIAQHLIDHGVFATSVDYPSAITWRPLLPTLVVTLLRLITDEPIRIYQLYAGAAVASFVAAAFLSARLLWGRGAAHLAAFLAFTCPAVTTYLINHPHSYSHLGGILFLGPAVYASLRLLKLADEGGPVPAARYAFAGLWWGLCYLCRAELMLFCFVLLAVAAWIHVARRRPLLPLAALSGGFLAVLVPYNLYAGHVATRDGILIRKTIYGFYISQGWVDPPSNAGPDIEADGYVYAQRLYGTAEENGENLLKAIARNPGAFARRVRLNLRSFYLRLWDAEFFHPWTAVAAAGLLTALATGLIPAGERKPLLFLAGLFAAAHFVVIYHIDARYLTVGMPALILLAAGAGHHLIRAGSRLPGPVRAVLVLALLAGIGDGSRAHFARLWRHREPNRTSVAAFRALGEQFRQAAAGYKSRVNREPHLRFIFPAKSPLYPEDQFLLAYFSRTAWFNAGAEGPFPRGRFYSYRDCPDDFLVVPDERIGDYRLMGTSRIVSSQDNPVLGRYHLVQVRP
ncbi:MAG: hypothetical protein ACOZE5_00710 [Verrucomicrobiota bacterium]